MKFITEDDLRRMYREAPFSEYPDQEGSRLTPGGRQFLLDRGVKIGERQIRLENPGRQPPVKLKPGGDTEQDLRVKLALQTISAVFLQAGVDLLETDILLAQEVFTLEQYLVMLIRGEELPVKPDLMTGADPDCGNSGEHTKLSFEINGFHAQTEKGRVIVKLNYLKCLLLEQEPRLTGAVREGVNSIINRLSQMICRSLGGT